MRIMQPKQLNLFEKFAYGVWCMRERHRRGDKPLRGRLTVLGDPSERKWQGHQSRFWAQIAKYKEPEIELAACALGVFFLVDLHKRIGTFTDIGARAARHRHAGVCQRVWRYFWRLAVVANGSCRQQRRHPAG